MTYKDRFIWDDEKESENIKKHGVNFKDAADAFDDLFAYDEFDTENSTAQEDRFKRIAENCFICYAIVYTERGKLTRLISARRATNKEREEYEREFKTSMGIF